MEYQSTYPNRKTRRSFTNAAKASKARGYETVFEFGMRVSHNIKTGNNLHNEHVDRVLKAQEEFLMKREESYRTLLKDSGLNKTEIDTALNKWYETAVKQK